jgi:dephospho-CoA kinase
MPVIGITGGIATGKSLVTQLFKARGATTFSADDAARAVLTPGGPTLQVIARTFGKEMLRPDGALDRARLGQRIFTDPAAREQLNRIMHPPILRLLHAQIASAREDLPPTALIAVEMPLLFEAHLQDWFDAIVVVTASEATQVARLRARNGLDEAEARRRLEAQWPMADKVAHADFVIANEGTPEQAAEAVEALWNRLTSPP